MAAGPDLYLPFWTPDRVLTEHAAGRERRAERLNERLRGAQRVNVDDDSFSLNLDGLSEPPASDSAGSARHTISISAKKRKREDKENSGSLLQTKPIRGLAAKAMTGAPEEPSQPAIMESAKTQPLRPRDTAPIPLIGEFSSPHEPPPKGGEPGLLPSRAGLQPVEHLRPSISLLEEVKESPADAPGNGRRRTLLMSPSSGSNMNIQSVLSIDSTGPMSSSPVVRKVRRSDAAASIRSRSSARTAIHRSRVYELDELSPDTPRDAPVHEELNIVKPVNEASRLDKLIEHQEEPEPSSDEEAEEVDATEAAKTLISKRRSVRINSPELGSGSPAVEKESPEPVVTRIRPRPGKSPAIQKQPTRTSKASAPKRQPPEKQPAGEKATRDESPTEAERQKSSKGTGDTDIVEITVQRFTNHRRRADADADDTDPLQMELPFANRAGESVVDVLAQVCEEVTATTLAQFQQLATSADNPTKKKECRIKMRAVEAYRDELRARLLQHTIHLDHWHSLRKQLRQAKKDKLALREEILHLNSEREQVALRMDAVRIKHEAESKESTRRIHTSGIMHDIALAVEQGREAPELSHAALKKADLANLELLVARVADDASSGSSTGGLLQQVTDFNALLERTAQALESRP